MTTRVYWRDAARAFRYHPKETALEAANRLAQQWTQRFGVEVPEITETTTVRRERWTGAEVGRHLDRLIEICPEMRTSAPPRCDGEALVVFEFDGRVGQIDGRRRANLWRNRPEELFDVLVLEL